MNEKICTDLDQLLSRLDQSKKIVFTNGCFDLLHPGHIDLLTKAKDFGDLLIVGLNTDQSIKHLKGPDRPIFELQHRMIMLAALEAVDFIVPFDEATPINLISKLLPNVLVKGGDYKKEEIVGYHEVISAGGKVETINFTFDISTSQILTKLTKESNEN